MTPPNHGDVNSGSPVFHPFSWNPDYHPSHYGPGTPNPNSYSNYDSEEDSLSDDKHQLDIDVDDNASPFPMFDDVPGEFGDNGKKEDSKTDYKPHPTSTKPIPIRRQDDSKD